MPSQPRKIHGDDLLYRFFQETLEGPNAVSGLAQQLLTKMAIWLPLEVYSEWPILLPWVVRDSTCRGNAGKGVPDSWASPDPSGHLRDDNSLIKNLPRALSIRGHRGSGLASARMGTEFVAAHVWRQVRFSTSLASRLPQLNSFVPNVVWLPRQIAKLTDREGSLVQRTFQAMSWEIYRRATVSEHVRARAEESWSMLPEPAVEIQPVDLTMLNWFVTTPAFFRVRERRLSAVISALERLEAGLPIVDKVVASRYTEGLPQVGPEERSALLARLTSFLPEPTS